MVMDIVAIVIQGQSIAKFSRLPVTPPQPAFCGDNYEIAKSVADDLNEWKADNANISTIC